MDFFTASFGRMGLVHEEAAAIGGIMRVGHVLGDDMQHKDFPRNRKFAVLESYRVLTLYPAPETGIN